MLEQLIAIPTENPPGKNYRVCANLLESYLRRAGLDCERFVSGEPSAGDVAPECLLASYMRGQPALYFHGHYDVVPAQSPEQFHPLRKEHFVFGRGAADMKGGIVCMLYAILALKEVAPDLPGKIVLTLVPDEETGGQRGSAWLARQDFFGDGGIGMLLPEPSSGGVWNANRGAISLRVRVFGKSAHVGLQHQGLNAFERMHSVVAKLQQLKERVEKRITKFEVGSEQTRNSILMLGGESGGGTNFNVVPAECSFTIDRRINPEEDLDTEKGELLAVLTDCRKNGIALEWEIFQEGPSASSNKDEALGGALGRNVELVTGTPARFEMCPGLLENRFYAAKGIPAYAYGPGLLAVAHGPNEYIDLRRMIDTAAIYALTAIDVLRC